MIVSLVLRLMWGCMCYALKPIAEGLKDFNDKANSGFLVGYAAANIDYMILVAKLAIIFNEVIQGTTSLRVGKTQC